MFYTISGLPNCEKNVKDSLSSPPYLPSPTTTRLQGLLCADRQQRHEHQLSFGSHGTGLDAVLKGSTYKKRPKTALSSTKKRPSDVCRRSYNQGLVTMETLHHLDRAAYHDTHAWAKTAILFDHDHCAYMISKARRRT